MTRLLAIVATVVLALAVTAAPVTAAPFWAKAKGTHLPEPVIEL